MLSNYTVLETRIQCLLDGLIFVEKGLSVQVQRMLKMSRVYTLAEILGKYLLKKLRKIGDLIFDHGLELIVLSSNKGSRSAQMCRLARAFAAPMHKVWVYLKTEAKI